MRADLQHLFNTNLDDVWDGRVTVRHAVYLLGVSSNYPDSLIREKGLGQPWTPTVEAIARLHDLVLAFIAKDQFEQFAFPRPGQNKVLPGGEPAATNDDGTEMFAPTLAEFRERSGEFMSRVMNPS